MLEQLKVELKENGYTINTYGWGLLFFKGDSADFTVSFIDNNYVLTKHIGGIGETTKVNKKYKTLKGIMTYTLKQSV